MKQKNSDRIEDLRQMLISWQRDDLHKATNYYHTIETDKDAFTRGYRAALLAVITKIEDGNY